MVVKFHLIPALSPSTVFRITQSITNRKRNPDMQQPRFTPVITGKWEPICCFIFHNDGVLKVLIKGLDHLDQFLWDSILTHNDPEAVSVYGIEGFFKVDEVDVQRSIPLVDLLQNIPEDEYLVNSSSSYSEASLFFPE